MGVLTAKVLAEPTGDCKFNIMESASRKFAHPIHLPSALRYFFAAAAIATFVIPSSSRAQVDWFGKNKVQYRKLEWSVLRTPHFDIHFSDGYRELATRTGFILEQGYEKLSGDFSHRINWRIPVIVYGSQSDFQQTNVTWSLLPEGVLAFSEPMRRRIVIYFGGSNQEYANTAVHELVHLFTFDIVYGNLLKSVFSRSRLFPMPLWFAEGLAEYFSVGWDGSGEMFMRDAAVFDYLPDLEYADGYMAYKAGQAAIKYISETYGTGKVVEIMESLRSGSLTGALQSTLGITQEELSKNWKKSVRKQYWPLYADKKEPESYGRRLTDHAKKHHSMNTKPAFSPDGSEIVFFSDMKGLDGIYLMDALTGAVKKRLVSGMMTSRFESIKSMNSTLTYSPDGKRIAFVAKSDGFDRLFILSVPGGRVERKISLPLDFFHSPAWSPDGKSIVLVGSREGKSDLYLYNIERGSIEKLTDDTADESSPAWFPDGSRIAYSRSEITMPLPQFEPDSAGVMRLANVDFASRPQLRATESDIWSVDIVSLETRELVASAGNDRNPTIMPGSKEILFTSDETGIENLYRGSIESGAYYRFTDLLGGISSYSYSPAADRLVMSAFNQAGYDLFMMDEFSRKSIQSFSTGGPLVEHGGQFVQAAMDTILSVAQPIQPSVQIEETRYLEEESQPPTVIVDEDSREDIDPDTLEAIRRRVSQEVGAIKPYRAKLAADYVGDMASVYFFSGYGFGLMNQLAFSDLLGDHHLFVAFNLYQSIEDSDIEVSYFYLKNRINYAIGAFQYKNYLNSRVSSVGETFRDYKLFTERNYGLSGLVSYPFSTFTRLDLGTDAFISEREFFGYYRLMDGYYVFYLPERSTRYVIQPSLSLVHDSAYWGYFGPVIGSRWLVSVSQTLPLSNDMIDRFSVYYDLRKYLPLFYRNSLVFRSMGAASSREDRRVFFLGGPVTMRGYDYLQFSGSRILLFTLEYRFPLLDAIVFGWPGRWGLSDIGGSLFIDSGAAWGPDSYIEFHPSVSARSLNDVPFYSDFGFGFHVRFGYLVLNFQWGWPTDFSSTGQSMFQFSIGPLF